MVNKVPKTIFKILFGLGFNKIDPAIITDGIAITIDAIKSVTGLSRLLSPDIRLFTLSGAYN